MWELSQMNCVDIFSYTYEVTNVDWSSIGPIGNKS